MKLTMASSTSANSADCIGAGTCKPLGGYSVWSALPPLPADGGDDKPIVLVVAQMDSIDMFHDSIQVWMQFDTLCHKEHLIKVFHEGNMPQPEK